MGSIGKVASSITAPMGLGLGGALGGITEGMTPPVQQADQSRLQEALDAIRQQRAGLQQGLTNQQGVVDSSQQLLQNAASGKAPSAAQGVLQQGLDQGIAAQSALANSGAQANQVGRQKNAADMGAQLTQQTANQAGQLRANEMATARGQFSGAANQNLGQYLSALGQNYGQQVGGATGGAGLQQQALSQQAQNQAGLTGGLLNAGGGALALLSDETTKKDIKEVKTKSFLDAISPKSFEYIDPTSSAGDTPGEHLGVIAQEIEKAPGGKSMIIETQDGHKGIDIAGATGTLLASAAELNERLSKIEEFFKSKKKGAK